MSVSGVKVLRMLGAAAAIVLLATGCSSRHDPARPAPTRTYRMGFAAIPPRPDLGTILQTIDAFKSRSDVALILTSPPWDSLLAGSPPDRLVANDQVGLANYFRGLGLRVMVSIDPTDGLDRSRDAPALVAAGRSLAEPAIQQLYRRYVVAMDTLVRPDLLGIASETNLVRAIAPAALYQGEVAAANGAAADVRAFDTATRLFATVQVEVAWGGLVPASGYVGIAQDRSDFPFAQAIGLSSYPYFTVAEPESLPETYYSRLVEGSPLPVLVIEGGWPSESFGSIVSSAEKQRRYIVRHTALLDRAGAIAWFQLTFTDLDLAYFPPGVAPFARLGLVTDAFAPKPALAEWDAVFARALR